MALLNELQRIVQESKRALADSQPMVQMKIKIGALLMEAGLSYNSVGSLDRSRLWLLDDQRLGRKELNMMIGVVYHPSFQQIAFLVEETGEYSERRLNHSDGEPE